MEAADTETAIGGQVIEDGVLGGTCVAHVAHLAVLLVHANASTHFETETIVQHPFAYTVVQRGALVAVLSGHLIIGVHAERDVHPFQILASELVHLVGEQSIHRVACCAGGDAAAGRPTAAFVLDEAIQHQQAEYLPVQILRVALLVQLIEPVAHFRKTIAQLPVKIQVETDVRRDHASIDIDQHREWQRLLQAVAFAIHHRGTCCDQGIRCCFGEVARLQAHFRFHGITGPTHCTALHQLKTLFHQPVEIQSVSAAFHHERPVQVHRRVGSITEDEVRIAAYGRLITGCRIEDYREFRLLVHMDLHVQFNTRQMRSERIAQCFGIIRRSDTVLCIEIIGEDHDPFAVHQFNRAAGQYHTEYRSG